MSWNDDNWLSLVGAFSAAALGAESWVKALGVLAESTGSRCGELIGLGRAHAVPFNYVSDMDEGWAQEFIAIDGGNPAVNPIVRAGTQCAEGTVLSSAEFLTKQERRSNAFIQEHAARYDFAHICLTPLIKSEELLIGLAVMRSVSQGEISSEQRKIFASIAPHVRAAATTQLALDHQNIFSATGALESAHITAFICDASGRVKSMTSAADKFLSSNGLLRVEGGYLRGASHCTSQLLTQKIAAVIRASSPIHPPECTIALKDSHGRHVLIEVAHLPRHSNIPVLEPKALVIIRHPNRRSNHLEAILKAHYKLSTSEIDVCLKLTDGMSITDISDTRRSSVETVRKQLKTVFEKVGVHSQAELASMINLLG